MAALEEVARRTGRSKTEVVEYAILKLASAFPDLAGDVKRALLEVIMRDLHDVPTNVVEELKTQGSAAIHPIIPAIQRTIQENQPGSVPGIAGVS